MFLSPSTPKEHPDMVLSVPIHGAVISCWISTGQIENLSPGPASQAKPSQQSLTLARILQEDSGFSVCSAVLCMAQCCECQCCVKCSALCAFHTKSIVLCPAAQSSGARWTSILPLRLLEGNRGSRYATHTSCLVRTAISKNKLV